MPSLLATAAIHHHLVRQGLRMQVGLVVETGEAREVHHFCVLAGFGAEAINPYVAFETLEDIRVRRELPLTAYEVQKNFIKAIGKGILKVMSKMGISTYQSYCGAQIFDAIGLSSPLSRSISPAPPPPSRVSACGGGRGNRAPPCRGLWRQSDLQEHARCGRHLSVSPARRGACLDPGQRRQPSACRARQHPEKYKEFAQSINDQSERNLTIRGLMELKKAWPPLDEVEPASEIVKRFATGAMSYGSISWGAHHAGHRDEPHRRQVEHR
jgi:glutamate synthase (NADPH/NADH) large chain